MYYIWWLCRFHGLLLAEKVWINCYSDCFYIGELLFTKYDNFLTRFQNKLSHKTSHCDSSSSESCKLTGLKYLVSVVISGFRSAIWLAVSLHYQCVETLNSGNIIKWVGLLVYSLHCVFYYIIIIYIIIPTVSTCSDFNISPNLFYNH